MNVKRRRRKRKCLNCGQMYIPDPRTADRQRHCSRPECKRASKAWRQRRWLGKARNRDYFQGPEHVERVRQWRAKRPGYWRRSVKASSALQDDCAAQPVDCKGDTPRLTLDALQDDLLLQPPLVVGLIAHLTGSPLQDDIELVIRRMQAHGQMILGMGPGISVERKGHDRKTSCMSRARASHAASLQLGGSPSGP